MALDAAAMPLIFAADVYFAAARDIDYTRCALLP